MAGRPPSGFRMGTGAGGRAPLGTAMGRPPGTGMNLPTTARPGTRGGMLPGGALNSMVQISDRPVTRQGLGGIKTQGQGPQRQVLDKSYFLGLLRQKMNELNAEITRLTKEITQFNQENASFMTYEKRAEQLASEIKTAQGELADYNTIVDKLNTNAGFEDLKEDHDMLKAQNDKEAKSIDKLFSLKQDRESTLKQLERELEQERSKTQSIVADMPANLQQKYSKLMKQSLQLQQELERKQQDLDTLNQKVDNLEEEVSQSHVKQEAVSLYEKIAELEEKKISLIDEMKKKETPTEERERLLRQVKEDNQEIARMEKRANEIREKTEKLQDEIANLDMDLEEHHGERTAKYKELKKREEDMQEFLDSFDKNKLSSEDKHTEVEANIVTLLERISRATVQTKHMPSAKDFKQMQVDLNFKETEMVKSQDTSVGLDGEHARLQNDLEKVDQLETKITEELNSLKDKINTMTEELDKFSDLNTLKRSAEEKKNYLMEEKSSLEDAKTRLKGDVQNKSGEYGEKKKTLDENETYSQLGNLERKWQHIEQNNFAMKEFIAQKSSESNYSGLKENVGSWVVQINQHIVDTLSTGAR